MVKDERICKICGKHLRPLLSTDDWDTRCYHVTCFQGILRDLNNFNQVAYTKYSYKKRVAGMSVDEARKHAKENKGFVVSFD